MLKSSSFFSIGALSRRFFLFVIVSCVLLTVFRQTSYYENAKDKAKPYIQKILIKPAEETDSTITSEPHVEIEWEKESQIWPYRVYKSSPWTPPYFEAERFEEDVALAEGHIFLNPFNSTIYNKRCVKQTAPFIISQKDGELVFAFNETHGTRNLRAQDFGDSRQLSFWRGQSVQGHGFGEVVVMDEFYNEKIISLNNSGLTFTQNIDSARLAPGAIDFHEQQATAHGTILVTSYNSTPAQLESVGRFRQGWILDSLFYEIDPATNEVLFSWSAIDHIPTDESKLPVLSYEGNGSKKMPWDFFHINSVQRVGDDYLVCARHTWAIYMISGVDGHVIWKINGDGSSGDFGPLPEDAQFRWAHHARAHNVTPSSMQISLFDNHANKADKDTMASRGIVLSVSLPPDNLVSPVLSHVVGGGSPESDMVSVSQGNYQASLSNGNQFMAYGPYPVVREYGRASDGSKVLWQGRFGYDIAAQSYRTSKYEWHGTPGNWDPSLVVERGDEGSIKGYVSWNGATDVEAWNVYVATDRQDGTAREPVLAGRALKKGFETLFTLEQVPERNCVQVSAIQAGQEIRLSNWACLNERLEIITELAI